MSNKYDEKLAHRFFYSGYESKGEYASANVWYNQNIFYSYHAPIGVVLESTKVKIVDPDNPNGKKIPAPVLLVENDYYSHTTTRHVYTLIEACPWPADRILRISFPTFIRNSYDVESRDIPRFYAHLCSKAISHVKSSVMTTAREREELFRIVGMIGQLETFFGKCKKPSGYAVVTKMLNLIADKPRYAEYCKNKRKEMAAASRERNKQARSEEKKRQIVLEKKNALLTLKNKYAKLERTLKEKHDSLFADAYKKLIRNHGPLADVRPASIAALDMYHDAAASPVLQTVRFKLTRALTYKLHDLYDPYHVLLSEVCNTYGTRVYPDVNVSIDDDLKVTLNVNMKRMCTTRSVVVTTKEVRLFLKMRQRNESALHHKFKEGFMITSDWNSPYLQVGCHAFTHEFVEALQTFMLRPDEEILADYAAFEANINNVLTPIRDSLSSMRVMLAESKQKTELRIARLRKRGDNEHRKLESKIKAELEEQGLLHLW